jgi:hypothetical protein
MEAVAARLDAEITVTERSGFAADLGSAHGRVTFFRTCRRWLRGAPAKTGKPNEEVAAG